MLTLAEFNELKKHTGVQITWTQTKPPQQTMLIDKAIVQATKRENEAVVNAYGLSGISIQIAAPDLPVPPEKFDVFTDVQGFRHVADIVVPHKARGSGEVVSYTCYCKGK